MTQTRKKTKPTLRWAVKFADGSFSEVWIYQDKRNLMRDMRLYDLKTIYPKLKVVRVIIKELP